MSHADDTENEMDHMRDQDSEGFEMSEAEAELMQPVSMDPGNMDPGNMDPEGDGGNEGSGGGGIERHTLKAWREIRGMTQQDLAFATGLHVSSIWAIENAKMSPNLRSMQAIAGALQVLMDQINWPGPDEIQPSPSHRNRRKQTARTPRTSRGGTSTPKHQARVA